MLVVQPFAGHPTQTSGERWDAFVEADGGARWRLNDASTSTIFVLPAGRYRLASIRSESGQQINGIMAPDEWFEVVVDAVAYAGSWRIDSQVRLDLKKQVRGSVSFPREPIAALDPAPLGRYRFLIARRNERAAPLTPPAARTPRG